MTASSEWFGLAALIALLLLIPLLLKIRREAHKKKAAAANQWASRYYSDEKTQRIAARFVRLLESQINVPIERFTPTTNFLDDLKMDDLEPVEVLLAIEEEFKLVEVSEADAAKMLVIDDVIRYVTSRCS